jgi:hypothetical protein
MPLRHPNPMPISSLATVGMSKYRERLMPCAGSVAGRESYLPGQRFGRAQPDRTA